MEKMSIDIHYRENARKEEKRCYQYILSYLAKQWRYRWLEKCAVICLTLSTGCLVATITLFLLTMVFNVSGLSLYLVATCGAMVLLGALGLLTFKALERSGLRLAGELLREYASKITPVCSQMYQTNTHLIPISQIDNNTSNLKLVNSTNKNSVNIDC